jgi:hypothetical protein
MISRRSFATGVAAVGAVASAGCVDDNGESETGDGSGENVDQNEQENETIEEDTNPEEDIAPAEFEITDLAVDASEIAPGESVTVTATIQNVGGAEGTEQLQFDIDGTTVDRQNVGDTTYEEVTEGETVTEQVTIPSGESTTVSISVSRELTGTFEVSVAERSVTFEVVRALNELGEAYEGAGGLTVTLQSFELNEKTGSFEYIIEYVLENGTDGAIDEGGFQLYPVDPNKDPVQQFGTFDELFPGDTVSRSYTFEEEKSLEFDTLAYHPDQFFSQSPPSDALVWPVKY